MPARHYMSMCGQVSYDSGRSWNWYVVDTSAFEANGNFLEVSPEPCCIRSFTDAFYAMPQSFKTRVHWGNNPLDDSSQSIA